MKSIGMVAKIHILTSEQMCTLCYLIVFLLWFMLHNKQFFSLHIQWDCVKLVLYSHPWYCTWVFGVLNWNEFGSPLSISILSVPKYRIEYVLSPSEPLHWYTPCTRVCFWVCNQTFCSIGLRAFEQNRFTSYSTYLST